ncbi:MAG TPA: DUF2934 domain-containing protein [Geminicoccaceae bacterium]|nr:DUF2934 domain-containing protein [Geminicoccaceae bacterium]
MTDIEIENQTRHRAYAIWEAEGRPEGRALEHWLAAEATSRPAAPKARSPRTRRTPSGKGEGASAPRRPSVRSRTA